ncbi:MAG: 3-isopropylmalate dehydratase large subunit, partial [Dehalococcoidia bacterium]|nr:3-isopropylmalate dehydratase large subunit [Dehalococcoidia bacterium]
MPPKTLFEKVWESHVVHEEAGKPSLLYVDLHLVHEITTAQAFEGLRQTGRKVRRPDLTVATVDHNVPTWERSRPTTDLIAAKQIATLDDNAKFFNLPNYYDIYSENQGIVHVIGPELGYTQPGKVVVCGDSHTSTHGALGAFAFGIGTSEVEHVLATQTIPQMKPKTMEIRVNGQLPKGVTAKDIILGIIGRIGIGGAIGYAVEYTGDAIRALDMAGRMTVCNMSIEGGARCGMVAPDEKTFEYLKGRKFAPQGADWDKAVAAWKQLPTDPGATYDRLLEIDAAELTPNVTWGTNPSMVAPINGRVPDPATMTNSQERELAERALKYMDLQANMPIQDIMLDRVFIGSCTNSRMEDLRAAAEVAKGKKVASTVYAMVVPGSTSIKKQAEAEGLDVIFREAGF